MATPLEAEEHDFTNDNLNGIYTEVIGEPTLIRDTSLSQEDAEALEAEAECYRVKGPRERRKFCYEPRSLEEMDRERIGALRRCIEEERPDWVERIKWACEIDNDVYRIVSYSGVPPYPAVAILENMKARGELA